MSFGWRIEGAPIFTELIGSGTFNLALRGLSYHLPQKRLAG